MNTRLYNPSKTFPSSKCIVVKYLYVCNTLYNRWLTLIEMIKLNSGQTELNWNKMKTLKVPLPKLIHTILWYTRCDRCPVAGGLHGGWRRPANQFRIYLVGSPWMQYNFHVIIHVIILMWFPFNSNFRN